MAVTNSTTRALTDADREAVEAMLLAFEQSWGEGALAGFAERLPPDGPVRFAALVEAVKVDLERSWRTGRRPVVEDYLRAFPDLGSPGDVPADLLQAELEARQASGETVPLSAMVARFPDRAAELRKLVGSDAPTLDTPDLRAAASTGLAGSSTGEAESLPDSVGPYRVVRRLGRGGMGAVYLAHDTRLDRPVALKVPRLTGLGSDAVERFRREGRAAAALRHPNICPVYDVGEMNGVPYLAMAFVEGQTLAERVRTDPLPAAEVARLVRKLAVALAVAHRAGVIHRDLKPANVMVGPDGEPVVMDFGLARLGDGEADRLTGTGDVLGTPAYMAPEQVDRSAGPVGPATDVYGLGAVLYELLTGRPPFTGTLSETLWQIGCREPERPTVLRPDLDLRLEAIIMKAMAKRPADRYPTMDAFAAALDDYLNAPTVPVNRVARHLPTKPRASPSPRQPRSRRWWIAGAAAVLLLGGTALLLTRGGTLGGGDRPGPEPKKDPPRVALAEPKLRAVIGPTERSGWMGIGDVPLRFWGVAPDGHTLVYGDRNSEAVELWDAATAKKVATLPGHSRDVWVVDFSPDSRRLAVGSYKQVKVWSVPEGKELYTVTKHDTWVEAVAFSADGKSLFSVDLNGTAVTTEADSGKVVRAVGGKMLDTMAGRPFTRFSSDRSLFALLSETPIPFRDTATWAVRKSSRSFQRAEDGKFTADGKRLLVGTGEQVAFYNLEADKVEPVHQLHTRKVWTVDLSPDGTLVASGGEDKTALVWDLKEKKERAKLTGFAGPVWARFSPDGRTLFAWAKKDHSVRRLDLETGKELTPVGDLKAGVFRVLFCAKGNTLAVMDMDGKLALYDLFEAAD